jgi:hypothetical protein
MSKIGELRAGNNIDPDIGPDDVTIVLQPDGVKVLYRAALLNETGGTLRRVCLAAGIVDMIINDDETSEQFALIGREVLERDISAIQAKVDEAEAKTATKQ